MRSCKDVRIDELQRQLQELGQQSQTEIDSLRS
jgi:hypothetical protein